MRSIPPALLALALALALVGCPDDDDDATDDDDVTDDDDDDDVPEDWDWRIDEPVADGCVNMEDGSVSPEFSDQCLLYLAQGGNIDLMGIGDPFAGTGSLCAETEDGWTPSGEYESLAAMPDTPACDGDEWNVWGDYVEGRGPGGQAVPEPRPHLPEAAARLARRSDPAGLLHRPRLLEQRGLPLGGRTPSTHRRHSPARGRPRAPRGPADLARLYGADWLDRVDVASPDGVALLMGNLMSHRSTAQVAERLGVTRQTLGRWLGGRVEPRLPDFLACMEATSSLYRGLPLLVERVPLDAVGSTPLSPVASRVLLGLYLDSYRALPRHDSAWLGRRHRLADDDLELALDGLAEGGRIAWTGSHYQPLQVDYVGSPPRESEPELRAEAIDLLSQIVPIKKTYSMRWAPPRSSSTSCWP